MSSFIHDDFLLHSATARRLYFDYVAGLPIIDYHSHLDPRDLAADRTFATLTDLWIAPDPYKHRAMRIAGAPERMITGDAAAREKFAAWATVVPQTIGNPLFHWTALELKRGFGVDEMLSANTAEHVWERADELLATPAYSAQNLVACAGVECVCTSDRLLDDLLPHAQLAESSFTPRVLPSLRADDVTAVAAADYRDWVQRLGAAAQTPIGDFPAFCQAVRVRLDAFARLGCCMADHALDDFAYARVSKDEAERLFAARLRNDSLTAEKTARLQSALLHFLGAEYSRRDWAMQLHIGAQRHTSTLLRAQAGPAGGYAAIGAACDVASLCRFLDHLDVDGQLPRTILYTLNPADNAVLATLTGSFPGDGIRGKLQFGPAWWYNDHQAGIAKHLDDLAGFGLLSTFIGMTTDSRCLLSLVRHEYFRRILCDFLGSRVEAGDFPSDLAMLGQLVRDISYETPRQWITEAETQQP